MMMVLNRPNYLCVKDGKPYISRLWYASIKPTDSCWSMRRHSYSGRPCQMNTFPRNPSCRPQTRQAQTLPRWTWFDPVVVTHRSNTSDPEPPTTLDTRRTEDVIFRCRSPSPTRTAALADEAEQPKSLLVYSNWRNSIDRSRTCLKTPY